MWASSLKSPVAPLGVRLCVCRYIFIYIDILKSNPVGGCPFGLGTSTRGLQGFSTLSYLLFGQISPILFLCSWNLLEPLSLFEDHSPEGSSYHWHHCGLHFPDVFHFLFQPRGIFQASCVASSWYCCLVGLPHLPPLPSLLEFVCRHHVCLIFALVLSYPGMCFPFCLLDFWPMLVIDFPTHKASVLNTPYLTLFYILMLSIVTFFLLFSSLFKKIFSLSATPSIWQWYIYHCTSQFTRNLFH